MSDDERLRAAIQSIAIALDLHAAASEQAGAIAGLLVSMTAGEHLAAFNATPPGIERIYLAILYLDVTKRTSEASLEVLTLFMLPRLGDETISTVEDLQEFAGTLLIYTPAFGERFEKLRNYSGAIDLLRRHRLEHIYVAHEWLMEYVAELRTTMRSIAAAFEPVCGAALKNDVEHAESRATIERMAPDVVAAFTRFSGGLTDRIDDLFGRSLALRRYIQMQALTDVEAIAIATVEDNIALESEIAGCVGRNEARRAWEILQRSRSTVLLSELPAIGTVHRAATDEQAWARRFEEARRIADPVARFAERLRIESRLSHTPGTLDLQRLYEQLMSQRDSSATVEYVLTDTATIALVLRPGDDEPFLVRIPITRQDMQEATEALLFGSSRFRRGVFEEGWRIAAGSQMGLATLDALAPLVQWIPDLLSDCRHICFIPYGELHALPLHALPVQTGEHRRFLVESHSVSYLPATALVPMCMVNDRAARDDRRALVAGTMFAGQDAEALHDHFQRVSTILEPGRTVLLEGLAATSAAIQARAGEGPWDLVYLHGHGQFGPSDPWESGILLSDGRTLPTRRSVDNPHLLRVRDLVATQLTGDLCILASCLSGRSSVHAGEELVGLARSLFLSGFRSAITALWSFEVASGRRVIEEFLLRTFGDKLPKGTALAEVQCRMLRGEFGERWRHPYFWGAFVLLGDWR